MQGFDIYFRGEMLDDADPAAVREGVARLFKLEAAAAARLFSGKPVRVKHDVDADSASRYRAAFRDVGALVQIVAAGSAPPAAREEPGTPEPPAESPATGNAADPDGAAAGNAEPTLAEPGATLDHTPPPPPADIDTSGLEALPANSGSLEDCRVDKAPRPLPDIGHMKLVDD
jgi:hypothetical protein